MEAKILVKENSIKKANWFFLITIIWSIIVQFLPTPANSYQYIAFLVPITIYLFLHREQADRILKPNILNLKSMVIIVFIWLSALPLILLIVDLYIYIFGDALADIVSQDTHEYFFINMFFAAITPAIIEEILLRGIILDGYRYKSRIVAALANGLLFGMLHLNSFQFFHTFVAGFIASLLVMGTNSIFAGMFIHGINNGLPIILDYLYPMDPNIGYAEDPNFLSMFIYGVFGIIMVYLLIRLLFKVNNIPWENDLPKSEEKIFNLPLILSLIVFIGFSALIVYSLLYV